MSVLERFLKAVVLCWLATHWVNWTRKLGLRCPDGRQSCLLSWPEKQLETFLMIYIIWRRGQENFWDRSPDTLTTQFSFHLRDMKFEKPSFVIHEFMADPFAWISERSDALLKQRAWAATIASKNIAINLLRLVTQRGTEIERIWSIIRFV